MKNKASDEEDVGVSWGVRFKEAGTTSSITIGHTNIYVYVYIAAKTKEQRKIE